MRTAPTLPLDLPLRWKVYRVGVDTQTTGDCPTPKARRSGSATGLVAIGVTGVAVCCALPSLLASGVLVAAAGWGCGVLAAIAVAVGAIGALWLRRRLRPTASLAMDPTTEPLANPESSHVKVAE